MSMKKKLKKLKLNLIGIHLSEHGWTLFFVFFLIPSFILNEYENFLFGLITVFMFSTNFKISKQKIKNK